MKIYFSGSIAGGRAYLDTYKKIVAHLKKHHEVLTEHIVYDDIFTFEKDETANDIYARDIGWLDESDCVIAEISHPSLGVGYEICYAEKAGKPVLCLYHDGLFVSRMITGISAANVHSSAYRDEQELFHLIDKFLESCKEARVNKK